LSKVDTAGKFERAFSTAEAMHALDAAITDDMMMRIVPLMNSPLGFLTDRDPEQTDRDGRPLEPYTVSVVKRCLIESVLRGLNPVGNEFNIISARAYITKAGFSRLIREYPGLADLRLKIGVPRMSKSGEGAIVPCSATWTIDGAAQKLPDREIPIRVNRRMGSDAIIGKATRKLLAAVYEQMTGSDHTMPEGEVTDLDVVDTQQATSREADEPTVSDADDAIMGDEGDGNEPTPGEDDNKTDPPSPKPEAEKPALPEKYVAAVSNLAAKAGVDEAKADARLRDFMTRVMNTTPETASDKMITDVAKKVEAGSIMVDKG
jgi:hypothetical protein